jgi:hypothetical protein
MSDFLTRLAERQLATAPGVSPRLPSRFGPPVVSQLQREAPHQALGRVAALPSVAPPPRAAAAEGDDADDERRPAAPLVRAEPARPAFAGPAAAAELTPAPLMPPRVAGNGEEMPPAGRAQPRLEIVERLVRVRGGTTEPPLPPIARQKTDVASPRVEITNRAQAGRPFPSPAPLVPPGPGVPAVPQAFATDVPVVDRGAPPVVKVTIGRLEVRAAVPPPPLRERRTPPARKALSLEEYLDRRHGARR